MFGLGMTIKNVYFMFLILCKSRRIKKKKQNKMTKNEV